MKLKRMLSVSALGLSLLATSAFASGPSGNSRSGEGTSWSLTGWFHNLVAESHRECDQNGQDSGRGNNCEHGRGNGGGQWGTGGSPSRVTRGGPTQHTPRVSVPGPSPGGRGAARGYDTRVHK